jgi:group I intron endonuclease
MIGIYKITSPSNRVYIGQSTDIKKRFKSYKYGHCKKQRRLYASFSKYGFNLHILEVIEICDITELNDRERYWQEHYNVLSRYGLNCELTSTCNVRRELSIESKKIIGEKNRGSNNGMFGRKQTESFKIDRRNYRHSDESLLKISKSSTGENNNQAKLVLNLDTGIYYGYVGDAAFASGLKKDTLKQKLNGRRINNTSFIYV